MTIVSSDLVTPIVFVDLETDGLLTPWIPRGRRIWEASVIRRDVDGSEASRSWFVRRDDLQFDPELLSEQQKVSLSIAGFFGRHPEFGGTRELAKDTLLVSERQLAEDLTKWLAGTPTLVGATPSFDTSSIEELFRRNSQLDTDSTPPWRLRLVCVWSLVAGKLGLPPTSLTRDVVAATVGLQDTYSAHSAYEDCRWARDVYDRIVPPVVPTMNTL